MQIPSLRSCRCDQYIKYRTLLSWPECIDFGQKKAKLPYAIAFAVKPDFVVSLDLEVFNSKVRYS